MAGFNTLEVARRALTAQRYGLDITSNNIANVNTAGYSRKQAILTATAPTAINNGFLGTGVVVDRIQTFRQEFHDREIRNTLSRRSAYESDDKTMMRVETALGEPSDYGIDAAMNKFYAAFETLTNAPDNVTRRQEVLNSAGVLAETFSTIGTKIEGLRFDTKEKINASVNNINQLLDGIASLNRDISLAQISDPNGSSPLIDHRALKLEELAKQTNITVNIDSGNIAMVAIGGQNVVDGIRPTKLKVQEETDPVTGERTTVIATLDPQGNPNGKIQPSGGELSSFLKHFNVTLDDRDSSGGYSVYKEINTLADTIVKRINAIANTGYGLDDTGATPPGRNIFAPAPAGGTITAMTIRVSNDVAGDPRAIPVSAAAGEPGNSEIARLISRTSHDTGFLNGMMPSQAYGTILSRVASIGQESLNGVKTSDMIFTQLNSQRESVLGVNLDEEAMNLIRYQKGFEAAARVVNVTNELLTSIINLGR